MSQGEPHALALALFLPRGTMPASPFRFVVLDDPIQAMDPAKVDGFVRVLARLAADRQVIVLSHDDRLSQEVRYLKVQVRILEVHRAPNSRVEVSAGSDPAHRYLEDARALAADDRPCWTERFRCPRAGPPELQPCWPRQALEDAVRRLCRSKGFDLDRATMRSRLIALRTLAGDEVADRAEVAWAGLSLAGHQHAYELVPASGEVAHLLALVGNLLSSPTSAPESAPVPADAGNGRLPVRVTDSEIPPGR